MKNTLLHIALVISHGLLLSLPWVNEYLAFVVFLAFIPLFMLRENLINVGNSKFFNTFFLFIFCYISYLVWILVSLNWTVRYSFWLTIALAVYYAALKAAVVAVAFVVSYKKSSVHFISWLTTLWIAFECVEFYFQAFCPWLILGNSLVAYLPIIQFYSFTGVLGGSLLVLMTNSFLYQYWTTRKLDSVLVVCSCLLIGSSLVLFYKPRIENTNSLTVVLVQPNFSTLSDDLDYESNYKYRKNTFRTLLANIQNANVVLFPETSINILLNESNPSSFSLIPLFDSLSNSNKLQSFVIGLYSYSKPDRSDFHNSLFAYTPSTQKIEIYSKNKLVPVVEEANIFNKWIQNLGDTLYGTYQKGTRLKVLKANAAFEVVPAICYESIYPQVFTSRISGKPSFISLSTNDIHFEGTAGMSQHLNMCKIRAIECGRQVARASNNGTTCIISELGIVKQKLQTSTTDVLSGNISLYSKPTFYSKVGNSLILIISLLIHFINLNYPIL